MGETRERGGEYADRANLSVERMSIVPPGTKQQFTALWLENQVEQVHKHRQGRTEKMSQKGGAKNRCPTPLYAYELRRTDGGRRTPPFWDISLRISQK